MAISAQTKAKIETASLIVAIAVSIVSIGLSIYGNVVANEALNLARGEIEALRQTSWAPIYKDEAVILLLPTNPGARIANLDVGPIGIPMADSLMWDFVRSPPVVSARLDTIVVRLDAASRLARHLSPHNISQDPDWSDGMKSCLSTLPFAVGYDYFINGELLSRIDEFQITGGCYVEYSIFDVDFYHVEYVRSFDLAAYSGDPNSRRVGPIRLRDEMAARVLPSVLVFRDTTFVVR